MHIKEYNGLEIKYPGPDLHQDEIDSLMYFLHKQIEEINNYSDKSLFFQNPQIIEGWLALVRAIEKIETWEAAEDKTKWEDRTETYVAYLLAMRQLFNKYEHLYQVYYKQINNLLDEYSNRGIGFCISGKGISTLNEDKYREDFEDVEDVTKFLAELNTRTAKAHADVFSVLTDVYRVLTVVMDCGERIVLDLNPYDAIFEKAIDDDLREWTFSFGCSILEDMKEDLTRHFKAYRTAPYTPELWGEMLSSDEEALLMASKQQLVNCDAIKQEHWGEDMKQLMEENGELMHFIYSSCRTERLFDIEKAERSQELIALLTPDNLSIFYDIIVRRNLIQCEMFPKLKTQHEEWLNKVNEQPEDNRDNELSEARQSKLDEIIGILQKGNWKLPATIENVTQLLNTICGRDVSLLEEGDEQICETMWAFVERGSGNRMEVVPANLAGFFSEENLLNGSPKTISNDLFGESNNQTNNINKGNSRRCSNAFKDVIPFLTKYTNKIIRQA